jgi:hypothetical protein
MTLVPTLVAGLTGDKIILVTQNDKAMTIDSLVYDRIPRGDDTTPTGELLNKHTHIACHVSAD